MARKKREFSTFSLSFLDIMACGFGSVVLLYLLMSHGIEREVEAHDRELQAEVDLLDEEVIDGQDNLVRLRNTLSHLDERTAEAQGLATRITEELADAQAEVKELDGQGFTGNDEVEALKAEVLELEAKVQKLRGEQPEGGGASAREFMGEGNRQYLTGMHLGGSRIAILVDTSASMLADQLVQIIRLRNMGKDVQRRADKWVRTLNTVDWLTAQLPIGAQYQVIVFNTEASHALADNGGKWLDVADSGSMDKISAALHDLTPSGGTSLANAFRALAALSPPADNIFLLTDGLPTQGVTAPGGAKVSGSERVKLFREAVKQLPKGVPVNIILAPLEGDPMAAWEYWHLAQISGGSFLSPSRDWP